MPALLLFVLSLWLALPGAGARAAPADPLLTLDIAGERQVLTRAEIEALGMQQVTMRHPEGLQGTFAGIWLDALLEAQGLDEARRVRFIALDGYTTFLSPAQRAEKAYLLVTRLDGEPLGIGELGPLMLVVPEDIEAVLDGTEPMTRWIWSLHEIHVR